MTEGVFHHKYRHNEDHRFDQNTQLSYVVTKSYVFNSSVNSSKISISKREIPLAILAPRRTPALF